MQFRILGPIEAWHDDEQLALGGPQQRALLAILLLNANHVVSTDRLIADIWGEQPPADARGLVRGCVARLRRVIRATGPATAPEPLPRRGPGYLLQVQPGELDLHRFNGLEAAAGEARAEGTGVGLARAADLLREALALWRGPALDGVSPGVCRAQAARLEEQRLAVLEQRIDVDLQLGHHDHLTGELQLHVHAHPLRERFWAQLMLALYAADRQADALAVYRQVRRTLVEQLGMEPGATLQQIEQAVLAGADAYAGYRQAHTTPVAPHARSSRPVSGQPPSGQPPSGQPPTGQPPQAVPPEAVPPEAIPPEAEPPPFNPGQLPAESTGFTGRRPHLRQLDALLAGETTAVVISAVVGTAGVGKTALAVHWAHRVRDRFPDGQLYVNLRGYAPAPPMHPIDALTGFLHALGVPADKIPADVEQAAGLYRSALADRRLLVVIDNARSAEQVRPLLPGSPGCLALITSRDRLSGLVVREGVQRIALDVLTRDEALGLLARLVGHDRVSAEPDAAADLARACAHLPLALRIAAAAVADRPQRSIASYVAELSAGNRLDALAVDGDEPTAVRATFDVSYDTQAPLAQRLFRLLGLVPGPDFTVDVAAALIDTTVATARPLLDRLVSAHLIGEHLPGRYAFHDLLRVYAAELAHRFDPSAERQAAVDRMLGWYLHSADAAARALYPSKLRLPPPPSGDPPPPLVASFDGQVQALAWLDAERPNLVAAIRHTATRGPWPAAWQLADVLRGYFQLHTNVIDWLEVANAGLAAARADGEPLAQAAAHLSLADLHRYRSRYPPAIAEYTRVVALARQAEWPDGQAAAITNLGLVYWELGRSEQAAEHANQALVIYQQLGSIAGQAANLGNLGLILCEQGYLKQAADHYAKGLALNRKRGDRSGQAIGLGSLGEIYHALGRLERARAYLADALALSRECGNRYAEAACLRTLAAVQCDAGRHAEAQEAAEAAVHIASDLGNSRHEASALNMLATVHQRLGEHAQAIDHHQQALRMAGQIEARYPSVEALIGLATAHHRAGQTDTARDHADLAIHAACTAGYRILEGQAHTARAAIDLDDGHPESAIKHAEQAVAIQSETGHRLGAAQALVVLGSALHRTDGPAAAEVHWRQALDVFSDVGTPEADRVRALLARP